MEYEFTNEEINEAVSFAVNYFLDPRKKLSGRTVGEPRGLGAIMDDFFLGKLIEIGVRRILEGLNDKKKYILDFEIKSTSKVKGDPDILAIIEGETERPPNLFVEIKATFQSYHWIGMKFSQLKTIRESSKKKPIFFIFASIIVESASNNPRTTDLLGMYLKSITDSPLFEPFEDLNARFKIDFIHTIEDLDSFGTDFLEGNLTYNTNLFEPLKIQIKNKDGSTRKDFELFKPHNDFKGDFKILRKDNTPDNDFGIFNINGTGDIYLNKRSLKAGGYSYNYYIYALKNVSISNGIFGTYSLEKEKGYKFNLTTLGSSPKLKDNNKWMAKRRLKELIEEGKIAKPEILMRRIANEL